MTTSHGENIVQSPIAITALNLLLKETYSCTLQAMKAHEWRTGVVFFLLVKSPAVDATDARQL
jgi:hypothetical protein